jgi:hypothetical protein
VTGEDWFGHSKFMGDIYTDKHTDSKVIS